MLKIIIHADDFGMSDDVNECIERCFLAGELSETSLMVNMAAMEDAVEMARRSGYAKCVGLHLNLTQGEPLTDEIRDCKLFCDEAGQFNKKFHLVAYKRLMFDGKEKSAVEKEIKAQLERFCDYDGLMMKLDSHHHVHTDWPVFDILRRIAPRYGFESMRLSANVASYRLAKRLYKRILNRKIRKVFRTTEWFCGIKDVMRYGRQLDDGVVELMVHPLYSEDKEILDMDVPYSETIGFVRRMGNTEIVAGQDAFPNMHR